MVRVAVIEDHPVVREGIKSILSKNDDFSVVAEASDGEQALQVLRTEPCDVVLLDISLPILSGVDILKRIRADYPRLPVLILSVHPEEEYGLRAMRAGAAGYLMKSKMTSWDLTTAIFKAVRGGRYISDTLRENLAFGARADRHNKPAHEILSDREYQTMCMLASGKTVSEIAAELSLSVKTVSTYRVRILEKLQFKNNAQLIRYAITEDLAS